jgi:hypothetical protein
MIDFEAKTGPEARQYARVFALLGGKTPIKQDCGRICCGACCKGTAEEGMLLFPGEPTSLPVREAGGGNRLAVCGGTCERSERPLACRLFPFFPVIEADEWEETSRTPGIGFDFVRYTRRRPAAQARLAAAT